MPERQKPTPLIDGRMQLKGLGFTFTMAELRLMHHRLHQALRNNLCRHYRDDYDAQGFNSKVIWRSLLAVHKACINERVPASVIMDVYSAARVAYENAIHLGREDAQARRQAVMAAQYPLEKYIDPTSGYDYAEAAEDVFDGRLSGCWTGRREGNA